MANPTRIEGDVYVVGNLSCLTFTPPAGCITDAAILAATNAAATKLEHQFVKHYSQESNTDSAVDRRCIHYTYGATGSVVAFEAGSITPCTGTATITVNLLKGNSSSTSLASILAAAIVLDNANTALISEAGSISSAALADGDSLFVDVAVAGGTAVGHGAFASCVIREKAQ